MLSHELVQPVPVWAIKLDPRINTRKDESELTVVNKPCVALAIENKRELFCLNAELHEANLLQVRAAEATAVSGSASCSTSRPTALRGALMLQETCEGITLPSTHSELADGGEVSQTIRVSQDCVRELKHSRAAVAPRLIELHEIRDSVRI